MTESRLTDLARMHIHPSILEGVSNAEIIRIFCNRKPRRLEFDLDTGMYKVKFFFFFFKIISINKFCFLKIVKGDLKLI